MRKVLAAGFQFTLGNYTENDIVVAEESMEGKGFGARFGCCTESG